MKRKFYYYETKVNTLERVNKGKSIKFIIVELDMDKVIIRNY